MTNQRTNFRSWDEEKEHRQKVVRKLQQVQGIEALLAEWEARPIDSDQYRDYLVHLRAKLRTARTNYEAMQP